MSAGWHIFGEAETAEAETRLRALMEATRGATAEVMALVAAGALAIAASKADCSLEWALRLVAESWPESPEGDAQ